MIPAAPRSVPTRNVARRGRGCRRSERGLSRPALAGLDSSAGTEDCAQVLHGKPRTGAATPAPGKRTAELFIEEIRAGSRSLR